MEKSIRHARLVGCAGRTCHYSSSSKTVALIRRSNEQSVPRGPPEDTLFSVQEMTYFHYFLTRLSHPLPLGNTSVWLKEIPQIAHTHHFLLHAILALGVSEMGRVNPGLQFSTEILKHRGQAIAGLQDGPRRRSSMGQLWTSRRHSRHFVHACVSIVTYDRWSSRF